MTRSSGPTPTGTTGRTSARLFTGQICGHSALTLPSCAQRHSLRGVSSKNEERAKSWPADRPVPVTLTASRSSSGQFIGRINKVGFSSRTTHSPTRLTDSQSLRGRHVSGSRAAMSSQSPTMASWSPSGASSAASRTIWTWARRVSGRWAPSQTSWMYRDSRKAAEAGEGDTGLSGRYLCGHIAHH